MLMTMVPIRRKQHTTVIVAVIPKQRPKMPREHSKKVILENIERQNSAHEREEQRQILFTTIFICIMQCIELSFYLYTTHKNILAA